MAEPIRVAMVAEQLFQAVPGGSGRYIDELTMAFPAIRNEIDVRPVGLTATTAGEQPFFPLVPVGIARPVLYELWNSVGFPRAERTLPDAQLVHATTWAVPPTRLPLVVTVHDLAFLDDPTQFTARGTRFFRRSLDRTRREADLVIVPSHVTARACAAHGIDQSRIRVIPHGVTQISLMGDAVATFRKVHHVGDDPYLFWCGTLEPRKNLAGTIAAFESFASTHRLVLAGPAGWGDSGMGALDNLSTQAKSRVSFVGRLSDYDLACAYAGAEAFLFPSFREGFGLPVLESMAYGTPVVSTSESPMEEFADGAGVFVDVSHPEQIAEGIARVLENRSGYAAVATEKATHYTWQESARAHGAAYQELL